jgi:tight adherence protein C
MSHIKTILIFLFLSPLLVLGIYLLSRENMDPLQLFHESFRQEHLGNTRKISNFGKGEVDLKRLNRISFYFGIGLLLLVIAGSGLGTILLLSGVLFIYRYWEKTSNSRKSKNTQLTAESEFPQLIELFTILVSSGESPSLALESIVSRSSGQLTLEFEKVLERMRTGENLTQSLEGLSLSTSSTILRRFADTLVLATQRGTSLSEILHSHVKEVRQQDHAAMLSAAGKAEVALMIPVIFLILPISVIFALWPSFVSLGQGIG